MSDLKNILCTEFADKEYAHGYMHGHLLERFAAQIHTLRMSRGLSQLELAKKSGVSQSKLSRLESADVDSFTLATVLKLADAFDVAVNVGFESFSALARKVEKSSHSDLDVPAREKDILAQNGVNNLVARLSMPFVVNEPVVTGVANQVEVPRARSMTP